MRPLLHVITDETVQTRFTHSELTRHISTNGADYVQYREKRAVPTVELCRVADEIHDLCGVSGHSKLVVNDRVDVAYAVGAAAIHLGRLDLPVFYAREILGSAARIGATANSLKEAEEVWHESIDYLGVGPVYGTSSKSNPAAELGLENLSRICATSPDPVIAIGNIQLHNVAEVIEAGAAGVAILSAIVCSDDPGQRTAEFVRELEKC
ncbi:MAG: thiamine phosphate synthase [Gammaproteobacteria bacterium]|nr:thiamine phosphate synthase [Gammaproteobacteria bacterium]